jgi:isochorismate pyruvate lyase
MKITDQAALDDLRTRIDQLDREIITLIARRTGLVTRVVELKDDEEAIRSTGRVEQVIERVRAHAVEQNLDPDLIEPTYRALIGALTELQLRHLATRF